MVLDISRSDLDPGIFQIWITDWNAWSSHAAGLKEHLTEDEIQRHARLKIPEKKDQFLNSRGILRLILSSYLDISPGLIQIESNSSGKPYLPDSDLSFNLSHSGDLLLYGFCLKANIGVDIQEVYHIASIESMIKKTISFKEQSYLERVSTKKRLDAFFDIWTAKEAYIKALGDGFQQDLTAISLIPDISESNFTLEHPSTENNSSEWTIRSIKVKPGYKGSFAVNRKLSRVDIDYIHPSLFYDHL